MLKVFGVNERDEHLEHVFHVLSYLKQHKKSTMVFDYTEPRFDEKVFKACNWEKFYLGAEEEKPLNLPELRGKPAILTGFVGADHAGYKETSRSHIGTIFWVTKHLFCSIQKGKLQ